MAQKPRLARTTVEGYLVTPCVYCGMSANTRDHFVPRSWRASMKTWRVGPWRDAPDTVPCCSECNNAAGAHPFATITAKREYIKDRYRHKYARMLARPFFTENELKGFGRTLRSHIDHEETTKLRLILRLAWPYELEDELAVLVRYVMRGQEPAEALNQIRREEILA